ncbi:hypothetical protein B0T22DRAFT_29095 [Podospora appendiculata]|uniref:Apple domain-containing protein n=1 Tax=Podospora appendiculata TaxID=314037 RepID=A0AAE0XG66_9PEZI|nr:hypothetical protein B0T22DRAFT_29095 [Podospora appendiculata]
MPAMDEQQLQKDAAPDKGKDIELTHQPRYQDESPGMQVVEPSTLEVVQPRQGLSNNRTWEKTSGLPETVYGYGPDPASPGSSQNGTPHTAYGSVAPAYHQSPYYSQPALVAQDVNGGGAGGGSPAPPAATIAGIKKQTFWVVLSIGIFLAVVAIAVGVGVGVSRANSSSSTTPTRPVPNVETTNPPSPRASIPTPARDLYPAPTAQGTTGPDQTVQCPLNNLTLYTSQADATKKFVLLCGRDFNSDRGTRDLYNEETHNMSGCIDACAKQPGCVGAGWGPSDGVNLCWLKSYLQFDKPNWSAGWYFAIRDNSTTTKAAAAAAAAAA